MLILNRGTSDKTWTSKYIKAFEYSIYLLFIKFTCRTLRPVRLYHNTLLVYRFSYKWVFTNLNPV